MRCYFTMHERSIIFPFHRCIVISSETLPNHSSGHAAKIREVAGIAAVRMGPFHAHWLPCVASMRPSSAVLAMEDAMRVDLAQHIAVIIKN